MKQIIRLVSVRSACIAVLFAILIPMVKIQAQTPTSIADARLLEIVEEDNLPSISVAISRQGKLVYSKATGMSDLENQVAATVNSLYQIGSITKTFTAIAALQLNEQGNLDLDIPVQSYCAAYPIKQQTITTYHLLSHTAGVRHYDYRRFNEDFLNKIHYDSIEGALTKFADDPLVSDPGSRYFYSSWGYVTAGCVVEGASNVTYMDFVKSSIIDRAELLRTEFDVLRNIIPNRVRGYALEDSGSFVNVGLFDASDRYPAGGILSTPTDLVRYGNAILSGKLLGEESISQMWSSAKLSSGEDTAYGLGWNISDEGETFHGGTSIGSTSFMYIDASREVIVALTTNLALWERDRLELARELATLFLSD